MKERDTNKADREFLDVYLGETRPQVAEPSEPAVHAKSAPTPKRISAKMRWGRWRLTSRPSLFLSS